MNAATPSSRSQDRIAPSTMPVGTNGAQIPPAVELRLALADGTGDPQVYRLLIDLPMASRAILAGIKTAAVINVGFATLGGLIAAGGYGSAIIAGLNRNDTLLQMEGAIPAVLMALAVPPAPETLMAAGAGTFLDSLLHLAGYTNAAAALGEQYPDVPLEKLVQMNPDVILEFGAPRSASAQAARYAAWQPVPGLRAVQQRRIIALGGPEWLSAGPRIAIELHRMITLLDTASQP